MRVLTWSATARLHGRHMLLLLLHMCVKELASAGRLSWLIVTADRGGAGRVVIVEHDHAYGCPILTNRKLTLIEHLMHRIVGRGCRRFIDHKRRRRLHRIVSMATGSHLRQRD